MRRSLALGLGLAGCGSPTLGGSDGGATDGGVTDGGATDGGAGDGGALDGGASDGGASDGGATDADSCALVTDLEDPWFLEGDTVGFVVSCSGELATDDAVFAAVSLPVGASFDTDARRFSWTTGPADGGRIDTVFSVAPSAGGAVPTAETVTFWVADDPSRPDNVPVDPLTYTEEWGLPVVHVRPRGTINQTFVRAQVTWRGVEYDGEIKIRGAASSYYPKPSYTLDFDHEEPEIAEWGETRENLVLLTTFDDNSYVRQKLIYDQWEAIADYWDQDRLTPRAFFVVVYLDRSYSGLYVMLDHIDAEFVRHMGLDGTGNLYKAIDHNANFYLTNVYGYAKGTLHDGYEQVEGDGFDDLDDLVGFTGGSTDDELLADAGDWLRIDEFMDWFLLVHYSASDDSGGKNSYLYKGPEDPAFRYVPWDFNHAWGQNWYTARVSKDSLNDFTWTNRVFLAIQDTGWSDAEQWERFAAMRDDGPYAPDWITGRLDAYYDQIEPSAQRDWDKWGSTYRSYAGWSGARNGSGDWTTYQEEKAYLYRWLDDRAALFEANHP